LTANIESPHRETPKNNNEEILIPTEFSKTLEQYKIKPLEEQAKFFHQPIPKYCESISFIISKTNNKDELNLFPKINLIIPVFFLCVIKK